MVRLVTPAHRVGPSHKGVTTGNAGLDAVISSVNDMIMGNTSGDGIDLEGLILGGVAGLYDIDPSVVEGAVDIGGTIANKVGDFIDEEQTKIVLDNTDNPTDPTDPPLFEF